MCGIVGYVGHKEAQPFLLQGLKKLEYRGYDSAGVAIQNEVEYNVKGMHLATQRVEEIRVMYGKQIGTDTFEDWQSTLQKKYCTLVWLKNVVRIPPMVVPRSNGAGWIVYK